MTSSVSQPISAHHKGLLFLLFGGSLFALGVWGLWEDVEWIAQPFYAYAWWGYIFILDGFVAIRRGNSLFTRRRGHVFPMLIWSVSFWYFFELLNLRFKNWYYVGVYKDLVIGYLFSVICFATVLIGMFQTFEAVTATGIWRNLRGTPRPFPRWFSYAVQAVGAAMVTTALVFPVYLAPLVWGSVSFLLDPWNYRRGARSILKDFEQRDFGLVARLLLAGVICGGFWESMNFFAPQKWIYTVRGLENLKLFEMPLLGFLGFPALALDGMAVYSMLSLWFLGNQTWENPHDLRYSLEPGPSFPRAAFWCSVPLQILFGAVVLIGVRQVNVASERLELEDLPGVTAEAKEVLLGEGIRRPIRLVREARVPERRTDFETKLNMSPGDFQTLLDEASLFAFKGIGARHGRLLQDVGIQRVEDLAGQGPEELHEALLESAEDAGFRPPRLDMVRVWVFAAQSQGIVLRAGEKMAWK